MSRVYENIAIDLLNCTYIDKPNIPEYEPSDCFLPTASSRDTIV